MRTGQIRQYAYSQTNPLFRMVHAAGWLWTGCPGYAYPVSINAWGRANYRAGVANGCHPNPGNHPRAGRMRGTAGHTGLRDC